MGKKKRRQVRKGWTWQKKSWAWHGWSFDSDNGVGHVFCISKSPRHDPHRCFLPTLLPSPPACHPFFSLPSLSIFSLSPTSTCLYLPVPPATLSYCFSLFAAGWGFLLTCLLLPCCLARRVLALPMGLVSASRTHHAFLPTPTLLSALGRGRHAILSGTLSHAFASSQSDSTLH